MKTFTQYITEARAKSYTWKIKNERGKVVCTVHVSADDIAELRARDPKRWQSWTDDELANEIYEQRFESELAKAGYSYDDAANFTAQCE